MDPKLAEKYIYPAKNAKSGGKPVQHFIRDHQGRRLLVVTAAFPGTPGWPVLEAGKGEPDSRRHDDDHPLKKEHAWR